MPAEDWSSALIESECWWSCVGPQTFHDQLWVLLLQRVKKFNRLVATAASYCSTSLKFSELFSVTPSFTKVCTGRLHSWVCDCIHLQQQEFKDSDRCGPEVVNFRLADIGDLKKSQQLWISQLFTHFQIFYFKLQDKQKYWVLVYINSYTTYTKLHMKNKRD